MTKWEINIYVTRETSIVGSVDVTAIWNRKDKKTGKSEWDDLQELASQGWELVSVTPIELGGTTRSLIYTFKRPIEEGS